MKNRLATRLRIRMSNAGKRFRALLTRGGRPSKPSSVAFEEEFLKVALARRTSLRRLALALGLRPLKEKSASADEEPLVDYGGDFLEAGEDPGYFARQAKQRKRVAVEARRLARRQRSPNKRFGLDRLPAALRRQLPRGWKR